MATRTEIILDDQGFVHRSIVETPLGPQDALLASLADASGIASPYMGKTPKGHPFAMSLTKNMGLMVVTELKELPLRTSFERHNQNWYLPTLDSGRVTLGLPFNDKPIPASHYHGRIFLGVEFLFSAPNNTGTLSPSRVIMILKMDGDEEARYQSYPNQYGDGSVCMGTLWTNSRTGGFTWFVDMFDHTVASFFATSPNRDLSTEHTIPLLRQDADGEWCKWTPEEIKSRCPLISNRWSPLILAAAKTIPPHVVKV